MAKTMVLYISGCICLLLGIFFATFKTNIWVMLGTILSVGGGTAMGWSLYFLPKRE